jgi:hypothetical protein
VNRLGSQREGWCYGTAESQKRRERRYLEIGALGKGILTPADSPLAMGECLTGVPCLSLFNLLARQTPDGKHVGVGQ